MIQTKIAMQNKLNTVFTDLTEHIEQLHEKTSKKQTRLTRTSIKEIRAYLDFIYHIHKKKYKDTSLQYLLNIYRKLGDYRKRQIADKRLVPYLEVLGAKSYEQYLHYADKKQQKANQKLQGELEKETPSLQELQQYLTEVLSSNTKYALGKYWLTYKSETERIIKSILKQKKISDDDIHIIRKKYKTLMYLSGILLIHNKRMVNACDVLQKQMGRRNDHLELILELKKYTHKHTNKQMKKLIKKIQKLAKKEKKYIIYNLMHKHFPEKEISK